jgi:hypothetical protein
MRRKETRTYQDNCDTKRKKKEGKKDINTPGMVIAANANDKKPYKMQLKTDL